MASRAVLAMWVVLISTGCEKRDVSPAPDTAFAALQQRGKKAMGVDQYASAHIFEPLPDGGRIVLQMKKPDSAEEAKIRSHMRTIAAAFSSGDFSLPGFVHDSVVPGTKAMSRLRAEISYAARDIERGGEVRLSTRNPEAVRAIRAFLEFQTADHHAGH